MMDTFNGISIMIVNDEISEMLMPHIIKYKDNCLWFLRENFNPVTIDEVFTVLDSIERYGDREAFIEVRRIKKWLLQNSSVTY
ncbi:MAG: hypothetical protein PF693_06265 [Spirochaetia bacterium]|jgi:hypothetical protein|nr:hypothetical protein [Spirochaetia bacterium]